MAAEAPEPADPLGRAMLDYQRGAPGTLVYRDGPETQDGRVHEFYFAPPAEWSDETVAILERLADRGGQVLDVGCGAGQHALWLQERDVDVTGVDASPLAVRAARDRGLENAGVADMFDLPFECGRFRSVHVVGTHLGLGRSLPGIADLLAEFARVTGEEGVAVVDNYDPNAVGEELLGYRSDPRTGVAHRCFHFEYERANDGEPTAEIGPTLHFLLCSPDRLRDATIGTPWTVGDVHPRQGHYRALLRKEERRTRRRGGVGRSRYVG